MRLKNISKEGYGTCYLFYSSNFKIGYTEDPLRRLKEIKNSSGKKHNLRYLFVDKKEVCKKLEKDLHKIFKEKKVKKRNSFSGKTEYFDLAKEDLENLVKKYNFFRCGISEGRIIYK